MLNTKHFTELVLEHACRTLNQPLNGLKTLILGAGAVSTGFTNLVTKHEDGSIGYGPFDMTAEEHSAVWLAIMQSDETGALVYTLGSASITAEFAEDEGSKWGFKIAPGAPAEMSGNLVYATMMIVLKCVLESPIPEGSSLEEIAEYWDTRVKRFDSPLSVDDFIETVKANNFHEEVKPDAANEADKPA